MLIVFQILCPWRNGWKLHVTRSYWLLVLEYYAKIYHSFHLLSPLYSDNRGGGGGDFVAGFLLGGAVFGTLAYIFAPQVIPSYCNFKFI